MKQAEKKSKAKSKNTVPLSKSEYETVKRQVSGKKQKETGCQAATDSTAVHTV